MCLSCLFVCSLCYFTWGGCLRWFVWIVNSVDTMCVISLGVFFCFCLVVFSSVVCINWVSGSVFMFVIPFVGLVVIICILTWLLLGYWFVCVVVSCFANSVGYLLLAVCFCVCVISGCLIMVVCTVLLWLLLFDVFGWLWLFCVVDICLGFRLW